MIIEHLPVSRLKRELNQTLRRLEAGYVDALLLTRRGERVATLVKNGPFIDWIHRMDHANSEFAQRQQRASTSENQAPATNALLPASDQHELGGRLDDDSEDPIALFTLGEMRMAGLKVPAPFEHEPDYRVLTVDHSTANRLARRILNDWVVPDDESAALLNGISDENLRYVLLIDQLLRVLSEEPRDYLAGETVRFDAQTPWSLIQRGDAGRVHANLAYRVFGGGWQADGPNSRCACSILPPAPGTDLLARR